MGVTDDGAIWLRGVEDEDGRRFYAIIEDRIVRMIRDKKYLTKIFVSKKEVHAPL